MLEWIPVDDSARVVAIAYDSEKETIYVRFPDGVEWWYASCPEQVWQEFSATGTSKGQKIAYFLNHHPNGRWVG
jgi:hypothetical protein